MLRKALMIGGGLIALVIIVRSRGVAANDTRVAANGSQRIIRTLEGR